MVTRREFIKGLSAITMAGIFPEVEAEAKEPFFLILTGQSNGSAGVTQDLERKYRFVPPRMKYYNGYYGKEMQFWESDRFGPEVPIAWEFASRNPTQPIYILKYVWGGTSIQQWAPDDNGKRPPRYNYLMTHIRRFAPEGKLKIFLNLVQGERDARSYDLASVWDIWTGRFVNSLREDLNCPEMPVLFSESNPPFPYVELLQERQRAFAESDKNAHIFRMAGLKKRSDGIHLTSESEWIMGYNRMAPRMYIETE